MRVLHIVKTSVGATWVYELVRVLVQLGVEVSVALPCANEGLGPAYERLGAKVMEADLDFPAARPWRLPTVVRACRRVVSQVQPDVIHTHHLGTTVVARTAMGKGSPIPRIFQVAGPLHLESPFFAGTEVRLADDCDYWVATCEWTRRKYIEMGIAPERVFFSYAATDVHRFTDQPPGKLRAELGLGPDRPIVGMVAYMYAPKWLMGENRGLKGHEDFIAALNLARAERPELFGVVIGGAWDNAAWYEERVRYRGRAVCKGSLAFLGTRRDVAALYPDLNLAVVPSHSENCGGAIEPLLSGVPVVATNVGGLPDVIRDGETGWLVPARNPAALARAIIEALSDRNEAARRARSGRTLVQSLFDVERTGEQVAAFYRRILGPRPASSRPERQAAFSSRRIGWRPQERESSEPMKILHVLGSLDPGGVETWLLQVLKNIDRDRFHFDFCTLGSDGGVYAPEVRRLGARIVPCPRNGNLWAFRQRFTRVLREGNYDVVHSHVHLFSGAVLRWAEAARVPIRIAHSHTSRDDKSQNFGRPLYARAMRSWIIRYATHGLAASRIAAENLFGNNWHADRRFSVLHYGIDLCPFHEGVDRQRVRSEIGIPVHAKVVGHVGRFVAPKNHQFLLDIAAQILKERSDIHFLLVGDGPLRPAIETRTQGMGRVENIHFAGTRTDVARLMRGAMDLFLFPSLYEGFGLAAVEAQAAGLRCLVSDTVSDETAVSRDSIEFLDLRTGANRWAGRISQLLDSVMSEPNRALADLHGNSFSIERSVEELTKIYQQVPASAAIPNLADQHA